MLDYSNPEEESRFPSPVLQPIKVPLEPQGTPSPYITTPSSLESSSSARSAEGEQPDGKESSAATQLTTSSHNRNRRRKKKQQRHQHPRRKRRRNHHMPCQGDAVLITYLDPNRPDIAREAGQHALNSASQTETDELTSDVSVTQSDVEGDEDRRPRRRGNEAREEASSARVAASENQARPISDPENGVTPDDKSDAQRRREMALRAAAPLPEKLRQSRADSIASSPALAKYTIPAVEANRESILPAMQISPPQTASVGSPEGSQSLPSLQTALGHIADPALAETPTDLSPFPQSSMLSPSISRPPFFPGHPARHAPSPAAFSVPSPTSVVESNKMSPSNHPSSFRIQPSQMAGSTSASLSSVTLPTAVAPATPYLTPKIQPSPSETSSMSPREQLRLSQASAPARNDPTVTTAATIASPPTSTDSVTSATLPNGASALAPLYKCTYPDCTTEPFQTQYLLNSHANVHSSSRPYYCPVPTCPRSYGGKGFKRKNERNRHGLVHDSPGFSCPFCLGQQHKYPRPDNLQRHVRFHHPEIKRDDARLRAVLATKTGAEDHDDSSPRGHRSRPFNTERTDSDDADVHSKL